jgi:hypothetical protein
MYYTSLLMNSLVSIVLGFILTVCVCVCVCTCASVFLSDVLRGGLLDWIGSASGSSWIQTGHASMGAESVVIGTHDVRRYGHMSEL